MREGDRVQRQPGIDPSHALFDTNRPSGRRPSVCFVPGTEPVQVYFPGNENGGALLALLGFGCFLYLVRVCLHMREPRPPLVEPLLTKRDLATLPAHDHTEQNWPSLADALEWAAERGDTERVRALLSAGADPYQLGRRGHSPLSAAIGRAHYDTAQVLLSPMSDAEKRRSRLKTALRVFVYAQNLRAVRYVLGQAPGIYDEPEDGTGESPLEGAATRGNASSYVCSWLAVPARSRVQARLTRIRSAPVTRR